MFALAELIRNITHGLYAGWIGIELNHPKLEFDHSL
jgi:hypothetical protein